MISSLQKLVLMSQNSLKTRMTKITNQLKKPSQKKNQQPPSLTVGNGMQAMMIALFYPVHLGWEFLILELNIGGVAMIPTQILNPVENKTVET